MRDWWSREVGGAPFWLLAVVPVLVVACLVLAVPAGLRPAPTNAGQVVAAGPAPTPTPTTFRVPADPRLLILGDSYTQGYAASPETRGYAYLVGKALGWKTDVQGVGDTGFTYGGPNGGHQDYGTRIRSYIAAGTFSPNVIVLEGSQNDYRAVPAITAAVVADVGLLRRAYPSAVIVLFGPAAPQPLLSRLGPIDAADQAAADRLGIPYISPYQEDWLTPANTKKYGFTDGAHLNTAGNAYLAQRFLADFRPLFGL